MNKNNSYGLNTTITPQKRRHESISNGTPLRELDTKRFKKSKSVKGKSKLVNGVRSTLRSIFLHPKPAQIDLSKIYSEAAMVELIKALVPHFSLGKGWTMNELPKSIPNYPFFMNEYNRKKYGKTTTNHLCNFEIGKPEMQMQMGQPKLEIGGTEPSSVTNHYQTVQLCTSEEWDTLNLDQKANLWCENFGKFVDNFKLKTRTQTAIFEHEKIKPNMLCFGLEINILYVLRIIKQRQRNERNKDFDLRKYHLRIKDLLTLWQKWIESNSFATHIITYSINYLLIVAHGFLICAILTEHISSHNCKLLAREAYIQCIQRISTVHKYIYENFDHFRDRFALQNRVDLKGWNPLTNVNAQRLGHTCTEWSWLHFDLNQNREYLRTNWLIGPYDGWIIEAYSRLGWTYDRASKDKRECLRKALQILRNKDSLGDITAIRIMIDYAYTHLALRQSETQTLHKHYWFYLVNISFGLINMSDLSPFANHELFDIKARFLCGCVANGLCAQPNYISFLQNFVKDSMNKCKTEPAWAIHRFLRIGYVCLSVGDIREANDLYRSARALMQYYTNAQLANKGLAKGERLMDEFEVWWAFNYFCVYAIATLTAYAITRFDSSHFKLLWDWVCWRNQCSRMLFTIAGLTNNARLHKYFGYFEAYKSGAQSLAFFGAQAMCLGVLHCGGSIEPDYKYLRTIVLLLEMAMKNEKFEKHCQVLGHFMQHSFALFAWTAQKRAQLKDML